MFPPIFASLIPDPQRRRDLGLFWTGHFLLVVLFIVVMLTGASAQETAPAVQQWPLLAMFLEAFTPLIVIVFGGIATALTPSLAALLRIKIDEARATALSNGFEQAASLALERLGDQLAGGIPQARREAAIASVVKYAKESYPGAVKHFGKTPEQLRKMAEIRLQGLIVAPGAEEQRVSAPVSPERT